MDYHLQNVLERVSAGDPDLHSTVLVKQDRTFLKFVKWKEGPDPGIISFNPLVFVLVYKVNLQTVKILLISYNEEILEDLETKVELETEMDDSLISHIIFNLTRFHQPCLGVPEEGIRDEEISRFLFEKFGDKIYIRSKKCARVLFEERSMCDECSLSLQPLPPLPLVQPAPLPDKPRPNRKIGPRTKKFGCDVNLCDFEFYKETELALHIQQQHPGVAHSLLERYNVCPAVGCGKVWVVRKGPTLSSHLERCTAAAQTNLASNSECNICGNSFRSPHFLKKHIAGVHEAPPLTCYICGAIVKGETPLRTHLKLVHGDTKFSCPEPGCDVTAKNRDHIKDHVAAIHRNQPRYVCSVCGTRYKYRNKWKYCEDKHRGVFLHQCTKCEKKFNDKKKFELHQRVHTGEKPFACPVCHFRMARMDNLNAHTKKAHGVTWREAEKLAQAQSTNPADYLLTEHVDLKQTSVEDELNLINCKQLLDEFKPLVEPFSVHPGQQDFVGDIP